MKSLGFLDGYPGDLIRPSLCSFIENVSKSIGYFQISDGSKTFTDDLVDSWQTILDECISNLDDDIRQSGLNAIRAFTWAFYSNEKFVFFKIENDELGELSN